MDDAGAPLFAPDDQEHHPSQSHRRHGAQYGLNDALKIGDRLRAYYATRAQGGVGLMIMGSTSVHPSSNSRLRPDEGGVCFIRGGSAYR